ncbi:MAG: ATP-binding protein [Roseobacter sp.]
MTVQLLPPFEIQIKNTTADIRDALSSLRNALEPLGLPAEEHGTVEMVVAEVLNNIVEHAYARTQSGEEKIDIHCAHKSDGLHLTITDQGQQLPNGALPAGEQAEVDVELEDLPEGGFGWFLIKTLVKSLHYQRLDGANQLDICLAVGVVQ